MGKLFLLALSLTASAPLFAGEATQHRFTRDGVTYVYTQTTDGDRIILKGRSFPSGSAFNLVVKNGRGNGMSGGIPVAFVAPASLEAGPVLAAQK